MGGNMINIEALNVCCEEKTLFSNSDLKIDKGTYLLDGEEDSGKSVLLNLIYNHGVKNILLSSNESFNFVVNGEVLMLSEDMILPSNQSEIEFMNLIAKLNNIKKPFSYIALYKEKPLNTYSKCELKIAQLNLLIEMNPDILLLDEPFESSNNKYNDYILNKIRNRDVDKITIVVTSIDEFKIHFCKRIEIINQKLNIIKL